ncbi:hypothetical protein OIU74_026013 [Salix koriyanagi]|uniref:Uncharacterized protein n=1 Tax=Salix koriyanagi TaxID=2511006 RepID=A0A9Q1A680_9ROSI|nr:hypothetical protein OIU74_026013 [Salix koriyanagi]
MARHDHLRQRSCLFPFTPALIRNQPQPRIYGREFPPRKETLIQCLFVMAFQRSQGFQIQIFPVFTFSNVHRGVDGAPCLENHQHAVMTSYRSFVGQNELHNAVIGTKNNAVEVVCRVINFVVKALECL